MVGVLLATSLPLSAQRLVFEPSHPIAGETIQFSYDPTGTPFATSARVDAVATCYLQGSAISEDIELTRMGQLYRGSFAPVREAVMISVRLSDPDDYEKSDDNEGRGWTSMVYQSDRKKPVPFAYAAHSSTLGSDQAARLEAYRMEFQNYPGSLDNEQVAGGYAATAKKAKNQAIIAEMKAAALSRLDNKKASEKDLLWSLQVYNSLEDSEMANSTMEQLRKKYPKGKIARLDLKKSFRESKSLDQQIALFQQFYKQYGKETDTETISTINSNASIIAGKLADEGKYDQVLPWLAYVSDKSRKAGLLNDIAWELCGEGLVGEAKNLAMAKQFSAMSVQLLEEEIRQPTAKPSYVSGKRYISNLKNSLSMFSDTYAVVAYRSGEYADALQYQEVALKAFADDVEMQERYCLYLEKAKGGKAAESALETLMMAGKANSGMKAQHKRLFLAHHSVETAYEKYIAVVEARIADIKRQEMMEKMLDETAPDFALLNLAGEKVTLESLRGKVVVVDFWATWCGPCKASFPAMQRAVDEHKTDDNVAFLFIDTWENENADKKKIAGDFVASKNYSFHVLLDEESKVVSDFKVSGIPTKFVIDKSGKIRFRSSGFNGNDDELVNELRLMIDIAASDAVSGKHPGQP